MGRNIDQLVTDQVLSWKQIRDKIEKEHRHQVFWPIITVSREYGAKGSELAGALGEKTGFAVWDKELVHAIAEKTGRNTRVLQSLDEHRQKSIENAIHSAMVGSSLSNTDYLRALMRLIYTIAAHGKSIIVGRGAHYILEPSTIFRVRVVCPLDMRVQAYAEQTNTSIRLARKKVVEIDTLRADYIRYNFKKVASYPADYDVIINSGVYDLDQSIRIIVSSYKEKTGLDLVSDDEGSR